MSADPLVVVVGPTATGKSDLALDVAERLSGGVILNADSMQLYRGLDVGTAKTPREQQRNIPHLLFDQLDVEQEASVADYQRLARAVVQEQRNLGRTVVAVGGSGLYVRALIDDFEFPGTEPEVRMRWQELAEREGSQKLHARLERLDPAAARTIHPNNERRLVRALEVIEITGRPFTASLPRGKYVFDSVVQLALRWDLDELDGRINRRTAAMFAGGLLEETRAILESGRTFGKTAARATGYEQALGVLSGRLDVSKATEQVALATRQLARRQLKWFRRDQRITWLDPHGDSLGGALEAVAQARS